MRYEFPLLSLPSTLDRVSRVLNDCNQHESSGSTIVETEDSVEIRLDVPGVKMDDIEMTLEKSALVIRGERKFSTPDNAKVTGSSPTETFERRFQLHDTLNPESADAVLDHGVLSVRFTRREELQPKKISIRSAE